MRQESKLKATAVQKIGIMNAHRNPTKNIKFLPRSALAPCPPRNVRECQARMHTPLPCAAGNSNRIPETLLLVLPRRKETRVGQDRPLLPLLAPAIRQAIREEVLALRRRWRRQGRGQLIRVVPWGGHARAVGEPFWASLEHRWVRETSDAR